MPPPNLTAVTGVKSGETGNIRAPHRVTTVTSDASGPHLLNLDITGGDSPHVQTATGFAGTYAFAARSRNVQNRDLCTYFTANTTDSIMETQVFRVKLWDVWKST